MEQKKLVGITNGEPQQQRPGRPNEGVTEDRNTLGMDGYMNGAGASYRG